jgi:hypothetical protein
MQLIFSATIENTLSGKISDTYNPFSEKNMPNDLEVLLEKQRIREVVENWVLWRDSGQWEKFKTVWHSDGVMMATWFQGPFEEFIKVSIDGWNKGVSILHFLGGCSVDVNNDRAITQTKMTITQRGPVDRH